MLRAETQSSSTVIWVADLWIHSSFSTTESEWVGIWQNKYHNEGKTSFFGSCPFPSERTDWCDILIEWSNPKITHWGVLWPHLYCDNVQLHLVKHSMTILNVLSQGWFVHIASLSVCWPAQGLKWFTNSCQWWEIKSKYSPFGV